MSFSFPSNPTVGQFSKQNNRVYQWSGYAWELYNDIFSVSVLIVGGGGPGGAAGIRPAGGGGGGGVVEQTIGVTLGATYTITVGGAGSFSRFGGITAIPGGNGANTGAPGFAGSVVGASAGGSPTNLAAGGRPQSLCSAQGSAGGLGNQGVSAGGGGGAGAQGEDKTSGTVSGAGGAGKSSSVPVSPTTYGGGGGGGGKAAATATTPGAGGSGGGGGGSNGTTAATNGAANTGGGGGGGAAEAAGTPGTGGSGIVVIRFPSTLTITVGAGLTSSSTTSGNDTIITFTAGTDNISFS